MAESGSPLPSYLTESSAAGSARDPTRESELAPSDQSLPSASPEGSTKAATLWRKVVVWFLTGLGATGVLGGIHEAGRIRERIETLQRTTEQLEEDRRALEKAVVDLARSTRVDAERVNSATLWINCRDREEATGKPYTFLWPNGECVEDPPAVVPSAAAVAVQPSTKR